ncbi:hypothetical protein NDU88_003499 [Pleurodeles waltl]|uniref:Uncharacterized protein n=1 Tax=Pleurodeles waltl TaxID=8319 RepID=A0AAV7TNV6_PLEWA|nr:hypothetical protein NDU88_003499 [Pleurodeles waltl]
MERRCGPSTERNDWIARGIRTAGTHDGGLPLGLGSAWGLPCLVTVQPPAWIGGAAPYPHGEWQCTSRRQRPGGHRPVCSVAP